MKRYLVFAGIAILFTACNQWDTHPGEDVVTQSGQPEGRPADQGEAGSPGQVSGSETGKGASGVQMNEGSAGNSQR